MLKIDFSNWKITLSKKNIAKQVLVDYTFYTQFFPLNYFLYFFYKGEEDIFILRFYLSNVSFVY